MTTSDVPFSCREFVERDLDQIVELSLLAWEPVFQSFRQILGPAIYPLIYPDWRTSQAEAVTRVCLDPDFHVLVAEVDGRVAGFVAYRLFPENATAEVELLAVHPAIQNHGLGTALNVAALDRMTAAGVKLAEVGTGGDDSHAPARRSYEKAGYTALPLVRYYQAL